jgi:membrane protein DedA with SNARE-associated domain
VGGFAAEQGHVGFVRVVLACTIGMWAASMLLYGIGRWNSAWVRLVLNRSSKRVGRLLLSMRAAPWRASIVSRVAFGVRIALPLACGAAHVDVGVFAAATALGALVWSAAFATLGWFFGESAVLVLGSVRRYENLILALFVAVGVFVFFIVRRRWRRMEGA